MGDLLRRVEPLLSRARGAVVLERVARGGGHTRWFFCPTFRDVELTIPRLRAGSRVGFFFDDRIRREPFSDAVENDIWDMLSDKGKVIFGVERPGDTELDIVVLDRNDFSSHVSVVRPGDIVFFGIFPAIDEDGASAISFTPPDPDGVISPQPM